LKDQAIHVFGDSIVLGTNGTPWPDQLQSQLPQNMKVSNHGKLGLRIHELSELIDLAHNQNAITNNDIIIIGCGTNNAIAIAEHEVCTNELSDNADIDQLRRYLCTSLSKTSLDLENLFSYLGDKFSCSFMYYGLLAVDETRMPLALDEEKHILAEYKNDTLYEYNQLIKSTCERNGIIFMNDWEQWKSNQLYINHTWDGLHPNNEGNRFIAKSIREYVLNTKVVSDT
jgi:lysophospholipase L1-like esterase